MIFSEPLHPVAALRCYTWLFFPLGLFFQQKLKRSEGLMDLKTVREVLLVCRRAGAPSRR